MLAQILLGFVLGLRHAADADHLVAVSGLLGDPAAQRRRWGAARVGALWGLGHLLSILLAGGVVLALRVHLPPWVEWSLELVVAFVLLGLGLHTIRAALRGRYHAHIHTHPGPLRHAHVHYHPREDAHDPAAHDAHLPAARRRPLWIGMVHGLAGTAGLTLLMLATIPSLWVGIAYLLLFGCGALVGMALLSTVLSWPLAQAPRRSRWVTAFRLAAGAANVAFGAFLVLQSLRPASLPF
jgi:hypothetical protein